MSSIPLTAPCSPINAKTRKSFLVPLTAPCSPRITEKKVPRYFKRRRSSIYMVPTFTPSVFGGGDKLYSELTDEDKLNTQQAIVNIFNTCVGVGILAKPYAFAIGGWYSVIVLFIAGCLCIYTAVLIGHIVESYNESRSKKIHTTEYDTIDLDNGETEAMYPAIAAYSLGDTYGPYGKQAVIFAILSILSPFFMVALVTIWTLLHQLLSVQAHININESLLFLVVFVLSIPPCLATSWKELTGLGYLGIVAVVSITATVIGLACYSYVISGEAVHSAENLFDLMANDKTATQNSASVLSGTDVGLFVSFVIFLMGIGGHTVLPKVHSNLKSNVNWMYVVTHGFGTVMLFYMVIGIIGFWLFGNATEIIILTNFLYWPGGPVPTLVVVLVVLNIWASFGIALSLIAENFEFYFNINEKDMKKKRMLRLGIFLILGVLSYFARYNLPFIETIQGIVGVVFSTVLTLPLFMYICCFWEESNFLSKIFHISLLGICLILGVFIFYVDIKYLS